MFSDRIRISLRLLAVLGTFPRGSFHTTKKLSEQSGCSLMNTRKRVTQLTNKGLLTTKGGHHGGVKFKRQPDRILVGPLIRDLGGFQHDPVESNCCGPEVSGDCFIEDWIEEFQSTVMGGVSVEDLTEYLRNSRSFKNQQERELLRSLPLPYPY